MPFFVVVIISVGSNAVAAYTGNNHACLRHKRFTDNDRDQQTYGYDWSGPEMTGNGHTFFFSNVKTINASSENTHAAVPEKLTINFCWPNRSFFLVVNTSTTIEFRIRYVTFDNIYYRFLCKKRFNREFDLF